MGEVVYDVPISEASKILEKSDRQVRRYVKEELAADRERLMEGEYFGESGREIVVDAQLIGEAEEVVEATEVDEQDVIVTEQAVGMAESGVKYAIDALTEQLRHLREENRELHERLEKTYAQTGFLQGKVEQLEKEVLMLMPAVKPEEAETEPEPPRGPWYKRMFGK